MACKDIAITQTWNPRKTMTVAHVLIHCAMGFEGHVIDEIKIIESV